MNDSIDADGVIRSLAERIAQLSVENAVLQARLAASQSPVADDS